MKLLLKAKEKIAVCRERTCSKYIIWRWLIVVLFWMPLLIIIFAPFIILNGIFDLISRASDKITEVVTEVVTSKISQRIHNRINDWAKKKEAAK